jgi:5-methylcytosine-specific restriction endonuclease McrA
VVRRPEPPPLDLSGGKMAYKDPTMAARKGREWAKANKERHAATVQAWRKANPDRAKEIARNWQHNNREKFRVKESNKRAKRRGNGGSYTVSEWEALKVKYDYTCLCCLKKEPDISLEADHVIPITKGGNSFIENIQPLCKPCNLKKMTLSTDYRLLNQRVENTNG